MNNTVKFLAAGFLTLTVLLFGFKNTSFAQTSALGAGTYEDNNTAIIYSGSWGNFSDTKASAGVFRYTSDPNATASFSFTGTKLTVLRVMAYNRGAMDICIDGTCQRVENYNIGVLYKQPVSFNVTSGTHAVVIKNTSTNFIDIDQIIVEATAAAPQPTIAPTIAPTIVAPTAQPTIAPTAAPTQQPVAPVVALAVPTIVAPANAASIAYEAQPVIFNWDAVSGALKYHLQISNNAAFSSFVYDVTPSSDGWAPQSPLTAGTYYWRVRAENGTNLGLWSATLSIVVTAPAPTPVAPQNSAVAMQVPYGASSPWNTPIPAGAPIDPNSGAMIAQMGKGTTGGKIYSDTAQYSYPIYWADKNTPRYNVPCSQYKCTVVDAAGNVTRVTSVNNVPIPNGAQQSAGNDAQMIIVDTETGIEYGFYHMFKQADGSWKADNGYVYNINYAGTQPGFGSRGAGVPYYAGMIRSHEIRSGEIKHAIAFVYQFTAASKCVYPASQTDGTTTGSSAIPEGARIQLNPNLTDADFDRMGLSRAGKIVARAMQKYGMILIDTGGSPKIIAENLTANTLYGISWADPDLNYTKDVIAGIPYTEFRVLDMPDATFTGGTPNYGKCFK